MGLGFALVVVVLVLACGLVVNFTALDKVCLLYTSVPFFYFLDEATTFQIADFEKLPSVLRAVSYTHLEQKGVRG